MQPLTSSGLYTDIADASLAFAHPRRRELLHAIAAGSPTPCLDGASRHHLEILKALGLLVDAEAGHQQQLCISRERYDCLRALYGHLRPLEDHE